MAKPADVLILDRLDEIDRNLKLVLNHQRKLEDYLAGHGPITPALEKQVLTALMLSKIIDHQVPDRKVIIPWQ